MKFGALSLSLILAAGIVGGVTLAQDGGAGGAAEPTATEAAAPAPVAPAKDVDALIAEFNAKARAKAEKAGETYADREFSTEERGWINAGAAAKRAASVEAMIAEYNAGLETARAFTDEEKLWIAMELDPADVDGVYEGYTAIPTGNPNIVLYMEAGQLQEPIESDPQYGTPPAAQNTAPLAEELDPALRPSIWVPVAASETAGEVDAMFNFIMYINYFFAALIAVLMVVFCVKYRRRPGVRADQSITHNTPLEIFWSVVPTILVAIMFWGGYKTFLDMRTSPPDAMQIYVKARQWGWDFTYTNGVETAGEFHVPANTPIEMVMTSNDVLHSFHLPAFRQKSDVLPNRYTKVWFDSGEPRTYRVYCSEYCGTSHSNMYAKLVVEPREDYEAWLKKEGNWMVGPDGEYKEPLEIGQLTYVRRGCNACHSIDGKHGTGPTFAGLWGIERRFDAAGDDKRIADEDYIRQSITQPHSQLVYPYGKNMTIYDPMLPEPQIIGMIEYIKSLADVPRDADAW